MVNNGPPPTGAGGVNDGGFCAPPPPKLNPAPPTGVKGRFPPVLAGDAGWLPKVKVPDAAFAGKPKEVPLAPKVDGLLGAELGCCPNRFVFDVGVAEEAPNVKAGGLEVGVGAPKVNPGADDGRDVSWVESLTG
jgi:hypothetical protein